MKLRQRNIPMMGDTIKPKQKKSGESGLGNTIANPGNVSGKWIGIGKDEAELENNAEPPAGAWSRARIKLPNRNMLRRKVNAVR
jgi:hypothetical protein